MRHMTRRKKGGSSKKTNFADSSPPPSKAAKSAALPSNATLLVQRLKNQHMEELILKSLRSGQALTMDDVLHALDPVASASSAPADGAEAGPVLTKSNSVVDKMCHVTRADLDHDFAQFDTNGDGTITLDEYLKIMKRGDEFTDDDEPLLVAMFQEMDKDGSNSVCYHEFATQWAQEDPGHTA